MVLTFLGPPYQRIAAAIDAGGFVAAGSAPSTGHGRRGFGGSGLGGIDVGG